MEQKKGEIAEEEKKSDIIEEKNILSNEIIDIINKEEYKKYINKNNNELFKLKIENIEKFSEYQKLLNSINILKIKNITFKNISTNDINNLLPESKDKQNLENICLENVKFQQCNIDINFSKLFPSIKQFRLMQCKLPFDLNMNFDFKSLTHLILDNIGLINENFEQLFNRIKINNELKNNLKVMSFRNNDIGMVDWTQGLSIQEIKKDLNFPNLEILDFSGNKIFYIDGNFINGMNNIKIIDLTNNSINFSTMYNAFLESSKNKKYLFLVTKNFALLKENNKQEYIKYLFDIFPIINYPIKILPLINLYRGIHYEKMKQLDLTKFGDSLIELDLSFGNINNIELISLLKKNLALYNLKKLNLKKNKLDEVLFDLLLENNLQEKFTKLKELNLSENDVKFNNNVNNYKNFFEKFKSIKLLIIKNTPLEICINNYIKNKINIHHQKQGNKYKFTPVDLEIKKIIDSDDHYLAQKTNIKISINSTINFKYLREIGKYYKDFLERIYIKTRYLEM